MEITANDILNITTFERLLEDCGCTNIIDKGNYFLCSSCFHDDKNPSFVFYKNSLHWEDFSGDVPRGSLETLIRKRKNMSLREYLGLSKQQVMTNVWNEKRTEKKIISIEEYKPEDYDLIIDGDIEYNIDKLKEDKEFWLYATRHRHMTEEFIEHFNISCSSKYTYVYIQKKDNYIDEPKKCFFGKRLCVPIIENGVLASIEGRRLDNNEDIVKCVYPASCNGVGGSSYRSLFNLDELDINEPLIVCEGIMDLPTIWQYFSKNCTCTYGASLKKRHKEDLKKFKKIITFFDSDEGGIKGTKQIRDFLDFEFEVACLPDGLDPGEATVSEIEKALNNRISSTEWFLKHH